MAGAVPLDVKPDHPCHHGKGEGDDDAVGHQGDILIRRRGHRRSEKARRASKSRGSRSKVQQDHGMQLAVDPLAIETNASCVASAAMRVSTRAWAGARPW